MALLLKNGRFVDPQVGLDNVCDMVIRDGRVVEVGTNLSIPKGIEVDCTDMVIVPGLVDLHTHLREPGYEYKETIATGACSALHGGFTDICCMPNTNPVADDASVIDLIYSRASEQPYCRIHPFGALTKGLKGERMAEYADLAAHGAVAFSDDGRGVQSAGMMRNIMDYAKMLGLPIVTHNEDETLAGHGVVNEGALSTRLGLPGQPTLAEAIPVARDCELAGLTGARLHIAHVSAKDTVDVIRAAKSAGRPVTAEATVHHLVLTEDELGSTYDTALKVNPPLRTSKDREALREALVDGTIDCIVTDHAPHAAHEKQREFELAAYGSVGFETAVPLIYTELIKPGLLSWSRYVEVTSVNPRKIIGLEPVKFEEGYLADITIIDPQFSTTIKEEDLHSKSRNCAFLGRKVQGRVRDVLRGGYFLLRDGEEVNE